MNTAGKVKAIWYPWLSLISGTANCPNPAPMLNTA